MMCNAPDVPLHANRAHISTRSYIFIFFIFDRCQDAGIRERLEQTYNDAVAADRNLDEHADAVLAAEEERPGTGPEGGRRAAPVAALRALVRTLTSRPDALCSRVTIPGEF